MSSRLGNLKASASEAASHLLETFFNKSITRRQLIDANQLQKLALTLNRPTLNGKDVSEHPPTKGTPVPPGYHLVYFTPNGTEAELGNDGSDTTFNVSAPFTRRMWAGGKMTWATDLSLRVGDDVHETTKLLSATPKKSRSVGEMVLVEVEKEYWGTKGLLLKDRRSWVFRPEIDLDAVKEVPKPLENTVRGPSIIKDIDAQSEEGHPGEVVHGPLNLINLLDYWRDIHGNGERPREISYRALSPLYAGQTYNIRTDAIKNTENGKTWDVLVEREGTVCMKSEITA
ncbi:hypothetical protein FGSG_10948 [Fusarium graminearum PH-1]|uniref:Chromosome 3, complete genome n=1 Tax=Gibberella zeae (strain ATCC MYA-4620 / CBS 123657 / FGSC 9075 / NRRL 31084 / PH-1) TaxID=229533 RepID=I1S2F6_GIBZE|nr:hypothetical protein FGSG_10948 [Fusarium graminearum PH-1]ESU17804.1 hypothetical protein FGSG_10948 [Fusarium graminearum PH-1]EYB28939.1 hypothetical protein FG05_10948 [Fusarium graminearum]PCD36755.1 hypothetical protein FGRA07_07759 [Fusarium graminearum]CEF87642.1 unnamed protein product [Fusarium graminearum]|eukprot:XP_011325426.1 hypothetical protein FGSG_10948 [Fusarium graminearum PH-1]